MADKLTIEILAKNLTGGAFRKISSSFRSLGKAASATFKRMTRAARNTAIALTAAMTAFGVSSVKAASEALEIESKFNAVFSGIEKQANETAKSISKDFDLISTTTRKLLGDTGDLLTGFGFTKKSALELSAQTVRLAGDLASFTNVEGGAEAATRALASAMLGETERAKALGVVIRQDSDEFKNLVEVNQKSRGATLLQAKAMAALTIAASQSKNAIGDYAKTQGFLANIMRKSQNQFKGFRIEVGKQLIDGLDITKMFNNLSESITNWTTKLKETKAVERWAERTKDKLGEVSDIFKRIFSEDSDVRSAGFDELLDIAYDMGTKFIDTVKPQAEKLGELIGRGISAGLKSEAAERTKEGTLGSIGASAGARAARVKNIITLGQPKEGESTLDMIKRLSATGQLQPDKIFAGGKEPVELGDNTINRITAGTAEAVSAGTQR